MDTTTHPSPSIVLVPGHWLGAWAWDAVAADLRGRGHQVIAVTLPGLDPDDPHRASTTLAQQADALRSAVDAAAADGSSVVLVTHSGAGLPTSVLLDRDPTVVTRVVHVDSGPSADGSAFDASVPPEEEEVPLPPFAQLRASLEGLSKEDLERFRERAVPQPALVMRIYSGGRSRSVSVSTTVRARSARPVPWPRQSGSKNSNHSTLCCASRSQRGATRSKRTGSRSSAWECSSTSCGRVSPIWKPGWTRRRRTRRVLSSTDPNSVRAEAKKTRAQRRSDARDKAKTEQARKPGRQRGEQGRHLAQVAEPEHRVIHRAPSCRGCGAGLAAAEVVSTQRRQVLDLPPVIVEVTEHVAERVRCACGAVNDATFPPEARSSACWGPGVRALGLYLTHRQHLPVERSAELMSDVLGAPVSIGLLTGLGVEGAGRLGRLIDRLKGLLRAEPVVHADETTTRVSASPWWLHVVASPTLTLPGCHHSRGRSASTTSACCPASKASSSMTS